MTLPARMQGGDVDLNGDLLGRVRELGGGERPDRLASVIVATADDLAADQLAGVLRMLPPPDRTRCGPTLDPRAAG